jgi:deoxyribose-phosphate aldolase
MKFMIKEEINRIKNLMLVNEENEMGQYMDSTYLKTSEQAGIGEEETEVIVFNTIKDAIEHNMKLVMLRPEYVEVARNLIDSEGANVLVGTVIDFPYGNGSVTDKVQEAKQAVNNGADELDFVIDYRAYLRGNVEKVSREIKEGSEIGLKNGKTVKWILETAALTEDQIGELTSIIRDVIIDNFGEGEAANVFVKTSTGFFTPEGGGPGGATEEAVSIMTNNAGPLKVKASGGIYSQDDLKKMVGAGASRIGTSAAKEIMLGQKTEKDY